MRALADSGRLTPEVVSELSSDDSKKRFKLSVPFLKRFDPDVDLRSQRRHQGGDRYWKQPLVVGGTEFLMFSQWYEKPTGFDQRAAFDQWVRDLRS